VASVTGFARRYRFDTFFRTEANIAFLQAGFVLLIFVIVVIAVSFSYLQGQGPFGIDSAILAATAVFGYVVARMTLSPTRTALGAQRRFVSNIAHELRTPLSIIKTNLEISLLESDLDPKFRKTIRSNIEEVDRISQIINNLLSMSTFLQPEKMEFTDIDIGVVTDHVLKTLMPLAEYKDITVTVKKSEYNMVLGNASALDQIVANIFKNAVTFTPSGGKIHITIVPDYRGSINFVVEDTGIGMNQKELKSIFEPFYRTEYSRNRAFGGSGLGLSIVSELVRLHHGKISIHSAIGKGTTVFISFICGGILHEKEEDISGVGEIAVDFSQT